MAALGLAVMTLGALCPTAKAQTNEWTWMSGSSTITCNASYCGPAGVYGTPYTPASGNVPGGRQDAAAWTDKNGNLWLMGGVIFFNTSNPEDTYLNDLWEFNPSTHEWAWMGGSSTVVCTSPKHCGEIGVYGTPSTPASGNVPGGRYSANTWTDSSGNLWLFGGYGFATNDHGYLNDLWEFNPTTREWAWMGGSNVLPLTSIVEPGEAGVYGTLYTPASGNIPGGRYAATTWTDSNGNIWLFGGYGTDSVDNPGYLNDLWEYNPTTNEWAWMGGSKTVPNATGGSGLNGVYGTPGTAAAGNFPGGRQNAVGWTDKSGNLWLLGGAGFSSTQGVTFLNDLWEFSPSTRKWAWMGGNNVPSFSDPGVYGTPGTPASGNLPGVRFSATNWADSSGGFWLFGGLGNDSAGTEGLLSDLWEFNPTSREWAWMDGSDICCQLGTYGSLYTPASGNAPGARSDATSWTDNSGGLWLFGGNGYSSNSTLGYLNDLWKYQTLEQSVTATPTFGLAAGTYASPQSVTILDATSGAAIYYTTNGDTPTTSSSKYNGTAIAVDSTETIKAIATANGHSNSSVASATYTITVGVTLSPATASVALGGTQVFTATLTNTTNTALNWYVNGVLNGNSTQGTLTTCTTSAPLTCKYTAPAVNVPSPNPAVIEVESVAEPTSTKTAAVTVTDSIAVTLTPGSASVALGGTDVLTATITGTTNTTLKWYVNGVLNGNSTQGTLTACTTVSPWKCTYTAPPVNVPSPNPAVIMVASAADPAKNKTSNVTVTDPIAVTLTPTSKSLALGATQIFTATITGATSNAALNWYVNGVKNGSSTHGTLTACTTSVPLTCTYTAPPVNVPSPNPAVIEVASSADPGKNKTANVTVTDPIAVTLTPSSATIALGATQVFTATITGATSNAALNWYVNGVKNGSSTQGTLTACTTSVPLTCTYTAPPVNVPSPNPAVIEVASSADPGKNKTANVTVTDPIAVTLTPSSATIALGATQVFTATITGATSNAGLNWYVNGVKNGNSTQGTLTACTTSAPLQCTYTAPPVNVPNPNPAVIEVASSADPGKNKSANVTVTDPIAVTLTPSSASIALGATQVLTATITGATSNAALNWYVNGVKNGNSTQGTLTACTTSAPLKCTYTAPPVNVPSPNPAVIEVASSADPGKNKSANVTVTDSIAVTLSPATKTLAEGATQVFTATISGTTNTALNWYVNGVLKGNSAQGTLTACTASSPWECTYTAPASALPSPNPAVIKVASAADPAKSKTANVTVTGP